MIHPTEKVSEGANKKLPQVGTTFTPVYWPWTPQCTALQTDR